MTKITDNSAFQNAQMLTIHVHQSPEEAPTYDRKEYSPVNIVSAAIVKKGTVNGNATVDLIIVDDEGNKYLGLLTGDIVEGLAAAIRGTRTQ